MIPFPSDQSAASMFQWGRNLVAWLQGQGQSAPTQAQSLWSPGDFKPWLGATAPPGWIAMIGQLVPIADQPNIYAVIGRRFCLEDDDETMFRLPDGQGRVFRGLADGDDPQGGSDTIVLESTNLPETAITVTDPGHGHTLTGTPHTHTVTDPKHGHSVSGNILQGTATVNVGGGAHAMANGTPGTLVTNTSSTNVTVNSATAGGTISSRTTGLSAVLPGDADPVDIRNPYFTGLWIIKT